MTIKDLIELRKKMKAKKPDFIRQDFHKKRLKKKWLKPRGSDSKMRQKIKDKPKVVSTGYGSPKSIRGFDNSGLKPVIVSNTKSLEKINKEKEGIIIMRTVGKKKRYDIVKKASKNSITILNVKDVSGFLSRIEKELKERKGRKEKLKEKREKKKKEGKKEKKEEKLADKLTEEEKKKEEKKEKDKILTKKE